VKRAGVTLVEMLIAMTVFSIFATSVTLVLIRNSWSDEGVTARREARGVARSALNIVESDLRMAEPNGVVSADDSTLVLRAPFAFGLVCGTSGGNSTISVLPSADLPSSLSVPEFSGWAYRDSTGTYQYQSTVSLSSGSSSTCTAVNITTLTASSGRVVQVPSAVNVGAGQAAFLYRTIVYAIRGSSMYPGRRGLYRQAGVNGGEEIAAPFATTARFRWFILDAAVPSDTLPTALGDLRGVQFGLTAESRTAPRGKTAPVQAPFTTSIFFQNRPN